MSSRPIDTAPASWSQYEAILDRIGETARLNAAIELSDAVRQLRLGGIRARHPEFSLREAVALLVAEDYGVELPQVE